MNKKQATELKGLIKNLHVLVVEDDDVVRNHIHEALSTFCENVDTAVNGKEGLEKYEKSGHDIVISDIKMPVMDGIEMIKSIKKIKPNQAIVVITAYDEVHHLVQLINLKIEKFIMKPLNMDAFWDILYGICKAIKEEQELVQYRKDLESLVDQQTEEIRRQKDWLQTTLSSIGDAVITTDEHGMVTFMNPVAEKLTKWPAEDAMGKQSEKVFQILNEHTRQAVESPIEKVLREGFL